MRQTLLMVFFSCAIGFSTPADATDVELLHQAVDKGAVSVRAKVIAWRRDFHQHPELANREFRTSKVVASQLERLGLEVKTGVAHTGVIGVLRGAKPGPVVALRADMDALPVTEETDLPFKSTVRTEYRGRNVGVMHACGHDAHMAILLGAAEVLASVKGELPGTIVFLFQPAEEGPPRGEEGGAALMIAEGVLRDPKVDAIFGLHVLPFESGSIRVRQSGIMAASDTLTITVNGRQTHGALPWEGIDPIVVASQIVLGLQGIVSRQTNLATAPAVVSIGKFEGGNRGNIIPERVTMEGTIRTFDSKMRLQIHERVRRTATKIAESAGASAEVSFSDGVPVTFNDPVLTERMIPSLRRVAKSRLDPNTPIVTVAEDFSYFQQQVPGVFFFLGVTPKDADPAAVAPNHSPRFFVDEDALDTGVRAMASLAVDYLSGIENAPQSKP